jgi:hypothetical protein
VSTEDIAVFWRRAEAQTSADEMEHRVVARYRDRQPLALDRQLRVAVVEARKTADAHGRLEVALQQQRAADAVAVARR